MAVLEVKVPQLSESVTEATLLQWHKKAGDAVALDENLVDIETDKVVLELPSPAAGVLASVLKKDGDTVVAGEVIATVAPGSGRVHLSQKFALSSRQHAEVDFFDDQRREKGNGSGFVEQGDQSRKCIQHIDVDSGDGNVFRGFRFGFRG